MKTAKIYMAGPLFTKAETEWNLQLAVDLEIMSGRILQPYLPQTLPINSMTTAADLFYGCVENLNDSVAVVACMDGSDPDSGTCWEVGYTYGRNLTIDHAPPVPGTWVAHKPIVLYRTDVRVEHPFGPCNLMLHCSADRILDCRFITRQDTAKSIYVELKSLLPGFKLP